MLPVKIIIGRFQVPALTKAHKDFLQAVEADLFTRFRPVIFLGISPLDGRDERNPYQYARRRVAHFSDYNIVLPLGDCATDQEWSEKLDYQLSLMFPDCECQLYGGRDSFIPHYKGRHNTKQIVLPPNASYVSGEDMRAAITPITSSDFLSGEAYALRRLFPKVYPTVDMGVFRACSSGKSWTEILLIKRADNGEWGLPGGFVDPTDQDYLAAARRELMEEVGVNLEVGDFKCEGSFKIDDWRYRKSRDKIITTLFSATRLWGAPINPNPREVAEVGWFDKTEALKCVSATHRPLLEALYR